MAMWYLLALAASADPGVNQRVEDVVRSHLSLPSDRMLRTVAWKGGARVWVPQQIDGIPVELGDRLVIFDGSHRIREIRGASIVGVNTVPILTAADAIRQVWVPGRGALWDPRAELVVFGPAERLAWAVDRSTADPPATWRIWVDARNGKVLHGMPTSRTAEAEVYPQNPANSSLEVVTLEGLVSPDRLEGEYADAWSCVDSVFSDNLFGINQCLEAERIALPNSNGDYFFDPDAGGTDPLAEVLIYHHTDKVARWFDARYGFRIPPLTLHANLPLANAFYGDFDGDGAADLSFGQSEDGVDFGYDADVVYHEYGHAVMAGISQLGFAAADSYGMVWTGGALNEGTADALAMFLTGDPALAEYAGTMSGREGPIRDLSLLRSCPEDLRGEVHADGELWGALLWHLATDEAVGLEPTVDLAIGAASTWTWQVTWPEAGQSLLDAADDLVAVDGLSEAGRAAVAAAVDEVGLLGCGRVIPLDEGAETRQMLMNLGLSADGALWPMGTQFSYTLPAGDDVMAFSLFDQSNATDRLGYTLFLRVNAPVGHREITVPGLGLALAIPETYDQMIEGSGALDWVLTADELGIEAGDTVYLAVAGRNLGGIVVGEDTRAWIGISALSEAQYVAPEEPVGGCGCRSTRAIPGWVALLPGPWLSRRRR